MDNEPTVGQLAAAADLAALLEAHGGGAIIGGLAVGLLANPRATKDVDGLVMFLSDEFAALLESAVRSGFNPAFPDMERFARQSRLLVLIHQSTGTRVDLMLGSTPFEAELIDRASDFRHLGFGLRLPTPEDLIIMKGIAHREQDMADIRAIAEVHPDLDRGRVEFWLAQYADLLDSPDLWDDVDLLLNKVLGSS
jgi:hypothetical protein